MNETLTTPIAKSRNRTRNTRIAFNLTMPNVGSWNGKWSGQGKLYALIRSVPTDKAEAILKKGYFHYSWSDGWGAGVVAGRVDTAREANKIKRRSSGFCGYDWMVDSIIEHGKIYASHEAPTQPVPGASNEANGVSVDAEGKASL
jgi:hypothetical protein